MAQTNKKPRPNKKKDRVQLEKEFLSCILLELRLLLTKAEGSSERVTEKYPCLSWRRFIDKRHRALWRALELIDTSKSLKERVNILKAESEHSQEYWDDSPAALKRLQGRAFGAAWIMHELAAFGGLGFSGGKIYIQDIFKTGTQKNETVLAHELGFMR